MRELQNMFGKSLDEVKVMHQAIRTSLKAHFDREIGLLWGFVRGFKYRRIERSNRTQVVNGEVYRHNRPNVHYLMRLCVNHNLPISRAEIEAWLDDPSGAIPAPPPRVKRPYIRPEEQETAAAE